MNPVRDESAGQEGGKGIESAVVTYSARSLGHRGLAVRGDFVRTCLLLAARVSVVPYDVPVRRRPKDTSQAIATIQWLGLRSCESA